jgi:hypothetical protein
MEMWSAGLTSIDASTRKILHGTDTREYQSA